MNGINKVILIGTLGSDPKELTSREGKSYTSLNLATNRSWKNKEGTVEKRTDWHRVTVWGKQASLCQQFLKKGNPVCVQGYLSTFDVEEDGKRRWITSITADDITFLPSRNDHATVS